MASKIFQVAEVNLYIKNLFRQDFLLNNLRIEGEVSNAKVHSSGHVYFTLKDESAAISCVLFAGYAENVGVLPKNGQKVVISGSISVYEKSGSYQVYVRDVRPAGQGDLFQKMEELKKKLAAEGIFQKPKKEIPALPEKIGIVTSATGAALQDILQIASRRNPAIQLILYPSLVQGERAAVNIAKGIDYFNRQKSPVDTIIIGRGGGSMEDLWPFNEEVVVRAIYHSKIPIISAVGHEIDVTLSDLASDLRAPTPSAAAELAIPARTNQKQAVAEMWLRLNKEFQIYWNRFQKEKEMLQLRLSHSHPRRKLDDIGTQLLERERELTREFSHYLKKVRWQIELKEKELAACDLSRKLEAGYAYLETSDGKPIANVSEVALNERITAYLRDGSLGLRVEEMKHGS